LFEPPAIGPNFDSTVQPTAADPQRPAPALAKQVIEQHASQGGTGQPQSGRKTIREWLRTKGGGHEKIGGCEFKKDEILR